MAQVYAFPTKRKLPKGMEDELKKVAKNYVEVLYATLILFDLETDKPTYEEVLELMEKTFAEGIYDAIEQLDEP